MHRKGLSCGPLKLESQDPFTRDIPTINFRRPKFPPSRGLQSQIGKILARSGRIERRCHHTTCRINSDSHADPHRASNGVSCPLGHVGQNFLKDFTLNQNASGCLRPRPGSKGGRRRSGASGTLLFLAGLLRGQPRFTRHGPVLWLWLTARLFGRNGRGTLSLRVTGQ